MNRRNYVKEYYVRNYCTGIDNEIRAVGNFLAENASGIVLDCGCGPAPQLWAFCMPKAVEIHAIDLPKESIDFVKEQLLTKKTWIKEFSSYQRLVEESTGKLSRNYLAQQIKKIRSLKQADMTKRLPFPKDTFDVVLSLYSLGTLKNNKELERALKNIRRVLKPTGKLIHINTNGRNRNDSLPEYTWRGLSQATQTIKRALKETNFAQVKTKEIKLKTQTHPMYKYSKLSFIIATK